MRIAELVKKWKDVLDEGTEIKRNSVVSSTAVMLENQHNYLNETTGWSGTPGSQDWGGTGDGRGLANWPTSGMFNKIAVPMVRRTFPELLAHDLVGVQPLTGPVGLAFALRFKTGGPDQYNSSDNVELGYNTIDSSYSGSYITSAGEALGSAKGSGVGNDIGLGIGAGTHMNEVNMTVEKVQVEAKTRKLRSRWSLEVAQDLRAMHGLNLEEEMMDILSYEITQEIDRELIAKIDAVCVAGGSSYDTTWNYTAASGTGVPGGRWEMERYRELYHYLVRRSNQIAIQTRRGSANWVIGDVNAVAIMETLAAFTIAPVPGNVVTAGIGISRLGSLDGRISVYRDTFQSNSQFILGYKGPSEYDTGVIYLPYIQLLASRAVFENSFQPTMGLMSRYAIHEHMFGAAKYYQKVTLQNIPV